ncbi:hypothetical protein P8H27_16595 [Pseudomonas sp. sp1636]|uniref:hypothetical protein n=1 Tax=Pseudomonas sp. sp1636 TaxID=3036707 RepID=UPI0025A5BDBB|nr:hypothetical protein [Pseudomonas sp. sp1636]MDM8350495.1 hypothetical protein [Pseudomonas sp. sp1636]
MVNGVSASSTALPTPSRQPSGNGPADIRAYLDFQLLLSRVTAGQQPLASAETAVEPQTSAAVAPACIEHDSGFQQFIAQRQFELSVRLNAAPEKVDHLTLMLLADALSAGSQSAPAESEGAKYPLTLA